jgi:hypothetical protein
MVRLHAFLALVAGLLTMIVLVVTGGALVRRWTPSWAAIERDPSPGYILSHLCGSFLAAAAGGYVTELAARINPLYHVLALGMIVLVVSALSVLESRGRQPIWFQLAQVAIAPAGVLAGGLVRMRVVGLL